MNRTLAALILALAVVGCHSQQPPTPPVTSCPTPVFASGQVSNYTEINPAANNTSLPVPNITALSYNWTPPSVGTWCILVQSWDLAAGTTLYQDSGPSNVGVATTTTADPVLSIAWQCPSCTGYSYILSYAAAVVVPAPTAPTLSTPSVVANLLKAPGNLTVRAGL